jgi:hypothetical protein
MASTGRHERRLFSFLQLLAQRCDWSCDTGAIILYQSAIVGMFMNRLGCNGGIGFCGEEELE